MWQATILAVPVGLSVQREVRTKDGNHISEPVDIQQYTARYAVYIVNMTELNESA
jgi:hypothetical protein